MIAGSLSCGFSISYGNDAQIIANVCSTLWYPTVLVESSNNNYFMYVVWVSLLAVLLFMYWHCRVNSLNKCESNRSVVGIPTIVCIEREKREICLQCIVSNIYLHCIDRCKMVTAQHFSKSKPSFKKKNRPIQKYETIK